MTLMKLAWPDPEKKKILPVLMGLSMVLSAAHATEDYAELTGKGCTHCHIDPSGGSELTPAGKDYFAGLTLADESGAERGSRIEVRGVFHYLRLLTGYLHIFIGIFWFGTR